MATERGSMIKEYGYIGKCYDGDIAHRIVMAGNHIANTQRRIQRENPGHSVGIKELNIDVSPTSFPSDSPIAPSREYKVSACFLIEKEDNNGNGNTRKVFNL